MKKFLTCMFVCLSAIMLFTGCSAKFDAGKNITVVSRDSASGTREAFEENVGLLKTIDGKKVSQLVAGAEEIESTGVVVTKVKTDVQAIGYISAGQVAAFGKDIKAIKVDGVAPTIDAIKDGSYGMQRPFVVVYKEANLVGVKADFEKFLRSKIAQDIIAGEGFVKLEGTVNGVEYGGAYAATSGTSGTIKISGSTSVAPVMDLLREKYKELNPSVVFNASEGGSGVGQSNVETDTSDFGMMSKGYKISSGKPELKFVQIAIDGVAIIVNTKNPIENLKKSQVLAIYINAQFASEKEIVQVKKWNQIAA